MSQIKTKWIEDDAITPAKLDSSGDFTVRSLTTTSNLAVGTDADISGDLVVDGDFNITGDLTLNDATVTGHLYFDPDEYISVVSGDADFRFPSKLIKIAGDEFTITSSDSTIRSSSGATYIEGSQDFNISAGASSYYFNKDGTVYFSSAPGLAFTFYEDWANQTYINSTSKYLNVLCADFNLVASNDSTLYTSGGGLNINSRVGTNINAGTSLWAFNDGTTYFSPFGSLSFQFYAAGAGKNDVYMDSISRSLHMTADRMSYVTNDMTITSSAGYYKYYYNNPVEVTIGASGKDGLYVVSDYDVAIRGDNTRSGGMGVMGLTSTDGTAIYGYVLGGSGVGLAGRFDGDILAYGDMTISSSAGFYKYYYNNSPLLTVGASQKDGIYVATNGQIGVRSDNTTVNGISIMGLTSTDGTAIYGYVLGGSGVGLAGRFDGDILAYGDMTISSSAGFYKFYYTNPPMLTVGANQKDGIYVVTNGQVGIRADNSSSNGIGMMGFSSTDGTAIYGYTLGGSDVAGLFYGKVRVDTFSGNGVDSSCRSTYSAVKGRNTDYAGVGIHGTAGDGLAVYGENNGSSNSTFYGINSANTGVIYLAGGYSQGNICFKAFANTTDATGLYIDASNGSSCGIQVENAGGGLALDVLGRVRVDGQEGDSTTVKGLSHESGGNCDMTFVRGLLVGITYHPGIACPYLYINDVKWGEVLRNLEGSEKETTETTDISTALNEGRNTITIKEEKSEITYFNKLEVEINGLGQTIFENKVFNKCNTFSFEIEKENEDDVVLLQSTGYYVKI